jgi:hypothetical protein
MSQEDERATKRMRFSTKDLPMFPHPFHSVHGEAFVEPRTKRDTKIYKLTSSIRTKTKWQEKIYNKEIVKKWTNEALEDLRDEVERESYYEEDDENSNEDEDDETVLEDKRKKRIEQKIVGIFEDAIEKLYAYSKLRDGLMEISAVDGVWQADHLVPEQVKIDLIKSVAVLENVPEEQKDWHPGSNKQVLDLVHPSLYCLVNGLSPVRTEELDTLVQEVETKGLAYCLTKMGGGNDAVFVQPEDQDDENYNYRNNEYDESSLPGEQDNTYSFSKKFQWLPSEVLVSQDGTAKFQSYINNLHPEQHQELYGTIEKIFTAFVPLFNMTLTDTCSGTVDLRGRRLQVIVKLANIILTPENPKYEGGAWHVEGMLNEHIVASGIYYYESENITESKLSFRASVQEPEDGDKQEFSYYFETPLVQYHGAIITKEDRCIVFPNVMQHKVSPFTLVDAQKPGVRKILVFFLVDPSERVLSTMNVPPQQQSWYVPALLRTRAFGDMPEELVSNIVEYLQVPMNSDVAAEYREELMAERKYFINENTSTYFERPCSLCEH